MALHSHRRQPWNAFRHCCWSFIWLVLVTNHARTYTETFAQGSVINTGLTAASSRIHLKKRAAVPAHLPRCRHAVDPSSRSDAAITGILLPEMEADEPAWLSYIITRYLDDEWMEQEVHQQIGEAVARLYAEAREKKGENDLVAVLASLSFGLKDMWKSAGFDEAFEGPVDVANRAAELLMLRMGKKVWSYGRSNDAVQEKMLKRLKEYEATRQSLSSSALG
eukprot:TRINITY_DN113022_c0_g1_i1.p1 TRINITY_DN113022_c0_g1~~TRINITY_DN113022_c0_g1_i1.p1  ORF type:complete len:222 (+),score=41.54 TRINITY_DN113022_c0_g1_i1:66-731(+)